MKVLIVGAGIGGLALSVFLGKQGINPVIIEKAKRWRNTGFIIGMTPNGLRMLEKLGLKDSVMTKSTEIKRAWIKF